MHEDIDDDGELNNKYLHKKSNAKRHGITCFLTFDEYAYLVRQAGIKSSNIGPAKYHLARLGDLGHYEIGNCRFIPYSDNAKERKPVDPIKLSSALREYYKNNPGSFTGKTHSKKTKSTIGAANAVSQSGKRNSQFGTRWITDGVVNRKIGKNDPLPRGWECGRVDCNQY